MIRPSTVVEGLRLWAFRRSDAVAIRDEGTGETTTWGRQHQLVRALADGLVDAGVEPNHRVTVERSGLRRSVVELAVWSIGAVVVVGADPASGRAPEVVVSDVGVETPRGSTDLDAVARRGLELDRDDPARFDELATTVKPTTLALLAPGAHGPREVTHGDLARAARAFLRSVDRDLPGRVWSGIELGTPAGRLVGVVVPALTGTELCWGVASADPRADVARRRPDLIVGDAEMWSAVARRLATVGDVGAPPGMLGLYRRLTAGVDAYRPRRQRTRAFALLDTTVGARLRHAVGIDRARGVMVGADEETLRAAALAGAELVGSLGASTPTGFVATVEPAAAGVSVRPLPGGKVERDEAGRLRATIAGEHGDAVWVDLGDPGWDVRLGHDVPPR